MKSKVFKIGMSVFFTLVVGALFLYVCIRGDLKNNLLSFLCSGLSFLLSLVFLKLTAKKIFLTTALAINVVADYFLVFSQVEKLRIVGLIALCVVQLIYLIYSLLLVKGVGIRITSLGFRVALCLCVALLLPKYIPLETFEMIQIMILLNFFVSTISLGYDWINEWITFAGFSLVLISYTFVILSKIVPDLLDTFSGTIAFYFYVPGILVIALSSVWENSKNRIRIIPAKIIHENTDKSATMAENKPSLKTETISHQDVPAKQENSGMSTISLDDL